MTETLRSLLCASGDSLACAALRVHDELLSRTRAHISTHMNRDRACRAYSRWLLQRYQQQGESSFAVLREALVRVASTEDAKCLSGLRHEERLHAVLARSGLVARLLSLTDVHGELHCA